MSEAAPEFKTGNGYFVKALNALGKYAQRHGIDPAGLPGWSQGDYGWTPPYNSPSVESSFRNWSLTVGADDEVSVTEGIVFDQTGKIEGRRTRGVDDGTYTVASGGFIVVELTSANSTEYLIKYFSAWPITEGFRAESVETAPGSGVYTFERCLYPLYEIKTKETGVFGQSIGTELVAVRLVNFGTLKVESALLETENGPVYGPWLSPF